MYVNKSYDLLCEQYYLTARIGDIRKLRYQINGVGEYHLQGSDALHVPRIFFSFKRQTTPIIFALTHVIHCRQFVFEAHTPIYDNKLNYTWVGFFPKSSLTYPKIHHRRYMLFKDSTISQRQTIVWYLYQFIEIYGNVIYVT